MGFAVALILLPLLGITPAHGTSFVKLPHRPWADYHHMEGDSIPTLVRKAEQLTQDIELLQKDKHFYHRDDRELRVCRGHILSGLADYAKSTPFVMDDAPASPLDLYVRTGHDLIGRLMICELAFFYVGLMGVWPGDLDDVGLKDHTGAVLTRKIGLRFMVEAAFLSGVNTHFVSACRLLETQWDWSTPFEIKGPHNTLTKDDVNALIAHFEPRQSPRFTACNRDMEGAHKLMPLKYIGHPW